MSVITQRVAEPPAWVGTLFDRIVCGVDGTDSSRVAVAQSTRLLPARQLLQLVSVVEGNPAPFAGQPPADDVERQYAEAHRALREGRSECPRARSLLAFGDPGPTLLAAAHDVDATLVTAGAPPSGRLGGIVLGNVGTHLLHNAPCSVLIARTSENERDFPRSIVVGLDGSKGSAAAYDVAEELAHRFDADLMPLVAGGDESVRADSIPPETVEWSSQSPVDALMTASDSADLIVVGSHGFRGLGTIGSVSERVAHLARCSVLVVREPKPDLPAAVDDEVPDSEC